MSKYLKLPTLLIVSESSVVRHWVRKNLENRYFILEAETGAKALEHTRSSALSLIIIDDAFQNIAVLKLCQEIRGALQEELIPLLLITGRLKKAYLEKALDAGVTDFLSAQLDMDELEARLATTQRAKALRERTSALSSHLKKRAPEQSKSYFQSKFLLHDQAVRMLAEAKLKDIPITLFLIRVDGFEKKEALIGSLEIQKFLSEFATSLTPFFPEESLIIPSVHGQLIVLTHRFEPKRAEEVAKAIQAAQDVFTLSIAVTSLDAKKQGQLDQMIAPALKALKGLRNETNLILPLDSGSA